MEDADLKTSICKVNGCQARAWQIELCNFHALESYRGGRQRRRATSEKLAEGKRLLRQRAQELGISLAKEKGCTEQPEVVAAMTGRVKVRSPVA